MLELMKALENSRLLIVCFAMLTHCGCTSGHMTGCSLGRSIPYGTYIRHPSECVDGVVVDLRDAGYVVNREGAVIVIEGKLVKARIETVTTPSKLSLEYKLLSLSAYELTRQEKRAANALWRVIEHRVDKWYGVAKPKE